MTQFDVAPSNGVPLIYASTLASIGRLRLAAPPPGGIVPVAGPVALRMILTSIEEPPRATCVDSGFTVAPAAGMLTVPPLFWPASTICPAGSVSGSIGPSLSEPPVSVAFRALSPVAAGGGVLSTGGDGATAVHSAFAGVPSTLP